MKKIPQFSQQTIVNGVAFGRATIVDASATPGLGTTSSSVPPGPTFAIRVPAAMLQLMHRGSSAALASAMLYYEASALMLLYIRAGSHLAVLLADLGDTDMRRYAADAVSVDALRVAMVTDDDVVVTASPLPAELRKALVSPARPSPAGLAVIAGAVSYVIRLLGDDVHLKVVHVDPARLKGRSLHLHLGPSALGISGDEAPTQRLPLH